MLKITSDLAQREQIEKLLLEQGVLRGRRQCGLFYFFVNVAIMLELIY